MPTFPPSSVSRNSRKSECNPTKASCVFMMFAQCKSCVSVDHIHGMCFDHFVIWYCLPRNAETPNALLFVCRREENKNWSSFGCVSLFHRTTHPTAFRFLFCVFVLHWLLLENRYSSTPLVVGLSSSGPYCDDCDTFEPAYAKLSSQLKTLKMPFLRVDVDQSQVSYVAMDCHKVQPRK